MIRPSNPGRPTFIHHPHRVYGKFRYHDTFVVIRSQEFLGQRVRNQPSSQRGREGIGLATSAEILFISSYPFLSQAPHPRSCPVPFDLYFSPCFRGFFFLG